MRMTPGSRNSFVSLNSFFSLLVAAMALSLSSGATEQTHAPAHGGTTIGQRKTAPDGITKGWLVLSAWPDDDPSQQWRTIDGPLVIARHGKVIRTIHAGPTFWTWGFWAGGRQVAYEVGPVHGITECVLKDVTSGRRISAFHSDCRNKPDNAPAWVKSLQ